jgi:hypothetical protein
MSDKTLKRLIGVLGAAGTIWLVVFLLSNRGGDTPPAIEGPIATFFSGLSDSTVTAVRFSRPGASVELERVGATWQVNGFRSDSGAVARFFETLRMSEVASLAASNASNHARMGVAADSAARMELDVGGSTRTMLFGLDGPRAATVYGRLPDEDEVYLVQSGLRAYAWRQLDDWRNRRMLALDSTQIRRVVVTRERDTFELVKGDSAWTFADGSPTDARQVGSLINELGGGLVASRFVEATDSIGRLPQAGRTIAYGPNGEQLAEVTVGSGSGDRWGMVAGDSVRYRIPSFRVDAIVPTRESIRP